MKFEQAKQMETIRARQYAVLSMGTVSGVWCDEEDDLEWDGVKANATQAPGKQLEN